MKQLILSALILFVAACMSFQGLAQKIPTDPKIKIGQLENGLKYFIVKNSKPEKKIELRLVINAGSILEDDDQKGLAHLMEHMNFNGTKNFPKNDLVHYLQSIGVKFGADLNAYTSFDETVYILPIPADDKKKIEQGFQILADWSGAALLENEEIDKERPVVLEESRMGKGADDRMFNKWYPVSMNGSKYGERLPIGDDELLKTFPHDAIKRFHRDWYRPDLQAVCVVGDIDPAEAERLIKEKFGQFKNPANERPRPTDFGVKPRTSSKVMVLSDPEAQYTQISIQGNPRFEKRATTAEEYLEEVIQNIYFTMLSERIQEFSTKPNPPFVYGYATNGGSWARNYAQIEFAAYCGVENIEAAISVLVQESNRAKKFGFTNAELERAKASLISQYEKMYNERDKTESGRKVNELVSHFLTEECIPGIEWEYDFIKKQLGAISLDKVNACGKLIDIDNNYFALVTTKTSDKLPNEAHVKDLIDKAFKLEVSSYTEKKLPSTLLSKAPTKGQIVKEVKNEKIGTTTWTLSNGAVVTFKKTDYKNDEILFSANRLGGWSLYSGVDFQSAKYSNNIVDEMGYGQFTSTDLQKFLSGKQVNVDLAIDEHKETINGRSSIKDFSTALELLYLKATEPRMDTELAASYKSKSIQMLEQQLSDPQTYFFDTLMSSITKNNKILRENPRKEDIMTINEKNAVEFYKNRFSSINGMQFYFVGSITEETFKPLVEKYLGGLNGAEIVKQPKPLNVEIWKGQNKLTVNKGSEPKGMVVDLSFDKMPYNQQEKIKTKLAFDVLNIRITDEIREKMNAIYSGGSYFTMEKYPREYVQVMSYLPCGPENVDKVREAYHRLLNDIAKDGNITADELQKVKETAIQQHKVDSKTNRYWLGKLSEQGTYEYDWTLVTDFETFLKGITVKDLTEMAKKYGNLANSVEGTLLPK